MAASDILSVTFPVKVNGYDLPGAVVASLFVDVAPNKLPGAVRT